MLTLTFLVYAVVLTSSATFFENSWKSCGAKVLACTAMLPLTYYLLLFKWLLKVVLMLDYFAVEVVLLIKSIIIKFIRVLC